MQAVELQPSENARQDIEPPESAEQHPEGLRERKKQATRKALGIAAMRLAVQRGLENVLVEDIAAEAGVSARTVNNYFSSKYEAICSLAADRGKLIADEVRARPASEPLLEAILNAVLRNHIAAEHGPDKTWINGVLMVIKCPALQGEYLKTLRATQRELAAAIAERAGTDEGTDMYPLVLAGAVTSAMQVATERWMHADPPVPLAPLIREAFSYLPAPRDDNQMAATGPRPKSETTC